MDIFKAVKEGKSLDILNFLDLTPKDVYNSTYESASFVIGLADRRNCIEVCHTPKLIEMWEEPTNPIFG